MRRRKARELALKMLYQIEVNGESPEVALDKYRKIFPYQDDVVEYTRFLLSGVTKEKKSLDAYIGGASEHWKLSRMTPVDKSILRIAAYEMLFSSDIPPKVAIDEALEMGKKFGSEESKDFINGILDKVLHDYYEKGDRKGK